MRKKTNNCLDCQTPSTGVRCWECFNKFKASNKTFDKVEWRRQRLYGMEAGQFDLMWEAQKGLCKLCDKVMLVPTSTRGQGLDVVAIDHCHATGVVRGLLCNACNKGLGLLNDDTKLMAKAIQYLEDFK